MENFNYDCIKVNFSDYTKEIGTLRREVWETVDGFDGTVFPGELWIDEYDKSAFHWVVFDQQKIIAAARLGVYFAHEDIPYIDLMKPYESHLKLPVASINRLVVKPEYKGNFISKALDVVRVEEAKKIDVKTIIGQAVTSRITWLEILGFEFIAKIGSIKELPNIELNLMIKNL
jgi:predicted GNAT family N-acyltransferase